MYFNCWALS
ncbi:hypothetical protein LINPERPRIM_LOCUS18619 [Linum perenne]